MFQLFRVLGDPNRLRIVNLLLSDELCVCELVDSLGLLQTNVSRNLAKLKTIGLVETKKDAQWVYYRVDPQFIDENGTLIDYLKSKFDDELQYKIDRENCNELKGQCRKTSCCK